MQPEPTFFCTTCLRSLVRVLTYICNGQKSTIIIDYKFKVIIVGCSLDGNGRGRRWEDVVGPRNRGSSYNYLNSYHQYFQINGYISLKKINGCIFSKDLVLNLLFLNMHVENWKLRVLLVLFLLSLCVIISNQTIPSSPSL